MIVYHGGTQRIEHPLVHLGRAGLDFGQGFYVTDIRQQAEDWADLMPLEMALKYLSQHQPNNQLCIRLQKVIDDCLVFTDSYQVKAYVE